MKAFIRIAAHADIERIYDWIARDSPRSAQSVIERIYDTIENNLARSPYIGHRGRAPGTYEWVVRGLPYVIVYRVNDELDELTVIAVIHGARKR
jgi:toxin ParE1/3/4